MQYFLDFFDVLFSINTLLPEPILFGLSLFFSVGLIRILIELL